MKAGRWPRTVLSGRAIPRVRGAFPGGTWNASIAFALTRRRTHGSRLEHPGFHSCYGVFRRRRGAFSCHPADSAMACQEKTFRASATLDHFFGALSIARAFCRATHHPGASKALVGVFDRNRSFLRWCCHLHHGGSLEAYIRRAAVSA